jgi:hypothetical protein
VEVDGAARLVDLQAKGLGGLRLKPGWVFEPAILSRRPRRSGLADVACEPWLSVGEGQVRSSSFSAGAAPTIPDLDPGRRDQFAGDPGPDSCVSIDTRHASIGCTTTVRPGLRVSGELRERSRS